MRKEKVYQYEFDFNGERRTYKVSAENEAESEYWFLDYLKSLLNIKEKVAEFEYDSDKSTNDLMEEALGKVEWEEHHYA